ncbi:MAG: metallophosphoesterase [Verrucomicrobiota bacterium]
MPVHLLNSHRRRFIRVSLGAGVGTLAWSSAADQAEHYALLADTHIDADPDLVANGAALAPNLTRVITEILEANKSRPISGVIINGDCALNDGQLGDYETLTKLLKPLQIAGIPVHLTMGNHDDRYNMGQVMKERQPDTPLVQQKHVSIIESAFANWFLLDTLEVVNRVTGALGAEQVTWLDAALAARSDKPALLIGHHYLQADPNAETITGIRDTALFRQILTKHRHVRAYISGHSHRWEVSDSAAGRPSFISLPPTAYVFDPKRPNGWVLASFDAAGLQLRLSTLDENHPEQGEKAEFPF